MIETAEAEPDALYESVEPILPLGLPFAPAKVSEGWFDWPALPDLFPASFPGVVTNRDSFLVDIDLDRLKARIADYFNPDLSHEEIARRYPIIMNTARHFDAHSTRNALLKRGGPNEDNFILYAYRPFDTRWLYWEGVGTLLHRPRAEYRPHLFKENLWLVAQKKSSQEWFPAPVISHIAAMGLTDFAATCFPIWLHEDGLNAANAGHRPNLSEAAQGYLRRIGASGEDLFYHALATLYDPAYREANAGALRLEWPEIPLPAGRVVRRKTLRRFWANPPRGAVNSPACWIPTRPFRVLLKLP